MTARILGPMASAASARSPEGPGQLEAWEVFRQEKDGDPMRHGGSVMAPDAELAMHYARELFGRVAASDEDFVDVQARLRALR